MLSTSVVDGRFAVLAPSPAHAADHNTGTRWSSAFADPQWFLVAVSW
ncbi:hypothetical protein ACFV2H_27530 [Streptomyces sp. NPDC059629]